MRKASFDPADTAVGQRIRARRLALDMSQMKLAEAIGVTFQQVQKYEKGSNRVSASRLQRMAEILEVTISHFFEPSSLEAVDDGCLAAFASSKDGRDLNRACVRGVPDFGDMDTCDQ